MGNVYLVADLYCTFQEVVGGARELLVCVLCACARTLMVTHANFNASKFALCKKFTEKFSPMA